MADDSFRLLSFTLPRRPFRYTTGNRQRLWLVRVKSDYGASGITSSFSKDTILSATMVSQFMGCSRIFSWRNPSSIRLRDVRHTLFLYLAVLYPKKTRFNTYGKTFRCYLSYEVTWSLIGPTDNTLSLSLLSIQIYILFFVVYIFFSFVLFLLCTHLTKQFIIFIVN